MTRALEAAKGFGTPPPLHRWMDAVLLLLVSLVQGVAATLGMWRKIEQRDWHTPSDASALPQAKDDIHLKEKSGTASLRLAVDAQRRNDSCCSPQTAQHHPKSFSALSREPLFNGVAAKKDSRVKPENDSAHVARQEADPMVRVPREGGDPVLRAAQTHDHRSAPTRAAQTPALILSLSKDAGDTVDGAVRPIA